MRVRTSIVILVSCVTAVELSGFQTTGQKSSEKKSGASVRKGGWSVVGQSFKQPKVEEGLVSDKNPAAPDKTGDFGFRDGSIPRTEPWQNPDLPQDPPPKVPKLETPEPVQVQGETEVPKAAPARPPTVGDYTEVRQDPAFPAVTFALEGALSGAVLSIVVLPFLSHFVLSKRSNADVLVLLAMFSQLKPRPPERTRSDSGSQEAGSAREQKNDRERQRSIEPRYAIANGYITEKEFSKLRSSYLVIGELAFGLGILCVAAVIGLGRAGWISSTAISPASAAVVWVFLLLTIERYHKFRSVYKTLVFERCDSTSNTSAPGSTLPIA